MRKILVTGAAGSIGKAVVRQLAEDPENEVVAVDWRNNSLNGDNIRTVKGEVANLDVKDLLDGIDSLVLLEWRNGRNAGLEDVPSSNIANLSALLDAAAAVQTPQVVFLSSATVYGAREQNPVPMTEVEQIAPNSEYPYAAQKAEAEERLLSYGELNPAAKICVLRSAVIINGNRETTLARVLGGYRALREPGTDHPVQFIHSDDVVSAIVHSVKNQLSGPYNVAPNGYIYDSLARELMGASVSSSVPRTMRDGARRLSFRMGRKEDAPQVEPYVDNPWVVANDKLRATGWEPKYSNEEALVSWRPSWWTRQSAGRKRVLVLAGGVSGIAAATAGAALGTRQIIKKRR